MTFNVSSNLKYYLVILVIFWTFFLESYEKEFHNNYLYFYMKHYEMKISQIKNKKLP